MDIFYPADDLECFIQLASFFAWAMAARLGWHFADWQLRAWKEFFQFLRQLLHRPRKPRS